MKQEHRFFVEGVSFAERDITFSDPILYHQLNRVLRFSRDDTVTLLDNTGYEYEVRILSLQKMKMEFYLLSKKETKAEPRIIIHLYQSLLKKKEKFEWVLQKGTEVGVSHFIPLRTEYSEFPGKMNMTRNIIILKEAAEQSHRGKIPELSSERLFSDALKEALGEKILFDPSGGDLTSFLGKSRRYSEFSIFIGPEGGFSQHEITLAHQNGVNIFNAGSRILRSETAGIVLPALFLITYEGL